MSQVPSCFGERWESTAVECAGGLDPSFVAPDGSNRRAKCPLYTQCAGKVISKRYGQHLPQLPAASRPQTPVGFSHLTQPASVPISTQQQLVQVRPMVNQTQQPYTNTPTAQMPTMLAPPAQAMLPSMVPVNFSPPYMQMTGYLTVPEPVVPGQHWSKRLGFSLIRSMLKASGHTVANFFDYFTFNPWYPPNKEQ